MLVAVFSVFPLLGNKQLVVSLSALMPLKCGGGLSSSRWPSAWALKDEQTDQDMGPLPTDSPTPKSL